MAVAVVSTFKARLLQPLESGEGESWTFLVLPNAASEPLPRRGRTSVQGRINGCAFQATLDPDGQLGHWLKVGEALRKAAGAKVGDIVEVELAAADPEPEPGVPKDLRAALAASPAAMATWEATTTLARVDWIHWVESAKQAKTRKSRVEGACDMLASGKKRVCCFDPSGHYSKSLRLPPTADGADHP